MTESLIPDLPPSPAFLTLDSAFEFLQAFARDHGVAFVKARTAKPYIINGKSTPTKINLVCDRGARRPSTSIHLRQAATRKIGCQFELFISCNIKTNSPWTYSVTNGRHNHGPSLDPSAHVVHRRRTPTQTKMIENLSQHKAIGAREVLDVILTSTPGPAFIKQKDVYNDRQKLRKAKLEGLTPTQQWINLLERSGLRHIILWDYEGDIRRPAAALWCFPWCEEMWRRFPEVLGLDNTYKTNRYNLYLFEVTGVTDHNSLANFAFGLMSGEKEPDFQQLCTQLDLFRCQLDIPVPNVVITDMEKALKNAIETIWPQTQQQICLFHINQKVHARIRSQFEDPPEAIVTEQNTKEKSHDSYSKPTSTPRPIEYSREGIIEAWNLVVYAAEEAGFEERWKQLVQRFGDQQSHILDYIESQYMPSREQWAGCFIRHYRNFGQRTNSPNETAHKDIKSYLQTGRGDLLTLFESMIQMLKRKERDYKEKAAQMEMRLRCDYIGRDWLGALPTQISYQAVNLLAGQHRLVQKALAAKISDWRCEDDDCSFTQQYALPCAHIIKARVEAEEPLELEDIHPRWWLVKPLVGAVFLCSYFTRKY